MKGLIKKVFALSVCFLIFTQVSISLTALSPRMTDSSIITLQKDPIERIEQSSQTPDAYFSDLLTQLQSDPNKHDYEPSMETVYMALRSLAIINKISQLNSLYPNFAFNYIMGRFNASASLFSEPMNQYAGYDSNYKLLGCGSVLTNTFAILALKELNLLDSLNEMQKQIILNMLIDAQNSDGSFGDGENRTSRASDTYFILKAIFTLNPSALSEPQLNLTKTWIQNKQQLNTAYGTQGGFPQPSQSPNEYAFMYETGFSLRIASMLNFSDINLPYFYQYMEHMYDPATAFVYNSRKYSYPNEHENPSNIVHTTSALFYLSVAESNISGPWDNNTFISYLLGILNSDGKWMTGIEGGKDRPYHSLETYWLGLELMERYNRISELSETMKTNLFWTIMNFSKNNDSMLSFTIIDPDEQSLSKYLLTQLYRFTFENPSDSEREEIYKKIKAHYNAYFNTFSDLPIGESFFLQRFTSCFLPFELRGFRLNTVSGYIYHPRNTYFAVRLLERIGLLDRFIAESDLGRFLEPNYVSSLVNINESYSTLGGMFVFSASGNRLNVMKYNEWISPDITYYHLKTIAFLSRSQNVSMNQIIDSLLGSKISAYARAYFPNVDQQVEPIPTAKLWEVLTILSSTTTSEHFDIQTFVQSVFDAPADKTLHHFSAANELYPYYASEISEPSQLSGIRERIQQLLNQEPEAEYMTEKIEAILRILEMHFYQPTAEIPDTLILGYPFDAVLQIETIALQRAFLSNVSVNVTIEHQSYPMLYALQTGYRISTPIYQNISTSTIQISISGSMGSHETIHISKPVQVRTHLAIQMQIPELVGNGSKWIREGDTLKGTFSMNYSYKDYADHYLPFYGFNETFQAFNSANTSIESISIMRTIKDTQNERITEIRVEIPIGTNSELKIRLEMFNPFLMNASSIQKPEFLKISEQLYSLIYETMIMVNQIEESKNDEKNQWIPELPLPILLGMGLSCGLLITLFKFNNRISKKRVIDIELTFND